MAGVEVGILGLCLAIAAVVVCLAILTVLFLRCRNRGSEDDAIVVSKPQMTRSKEIDFSEIELRVQEDSTRGDIGNRRRRDSGEKFK